MSLDNFLNNEKIKKIEDEICEELKRYNSSKKPENILWELPLDRKHNLILQIKDNGFLYFALTRISISKENQQLIFHSVFLSQTQLKILYERIPECLDNFKRLKHEKGLV